MFENRLFTYTIYDEKSCDDLIKSINSIFRRSMSYTNWLKTIDRSVCKASGLTNESVDIEVHHYDMTLWDITNYCIYKFIDENIVDFNDFYMCLLLSEIHLNKCVSYIPLSHDYHNMLHSNPMEFERLFPDYLVNVTWGDYLLRDDIINKYIKYYKENINVFK